MNAHPLDIPEFLKRDKNETRPAHTGPATNVQERKIKRPPGWHALTKAEQEGTADPATIQLRKWLEHDKAAKRAERFAKLKELAASRPKMPRVKIKPRYGVLYDKPTKRPKIGKAMRKTAEKREHDTERYGVITDGGAVAFSFNAKGSDDARAKLSAMRKAGDGKGITVKSLRRLKYGDKAVGGGPIKHLGGAA